MNNLAAIEGNILKDMIQQYKQLSLEELLGEYNHFQLVIYQHGMNRMRQLLMQNLTQLVNQRLQ